MNRKSSLRDRHDCAQEELVQIYIIGQNNSSISCPPMRFSKERVHEYYTVSGEDKELTNLSRSGLNDHEDQFKWYKGTCSQVIPLSDSPCPVPQYWETHTAIQVQEEVVPIWPLLEMGVCGEEEAVVWKGVPKVENPFKQWSWLSDHISASWSINVVNCPKDEHTGICTQVFERRRQITECWSSTQSLTPGTEVILKYGIVLDVPNGRLSFIDLDREIVVHKFDIEFTQPLLPMFSIRPWPKQLPTTMRLVSGSDVKMTSEKASLILKALPGTRTESSSLA